VKTFVVVLVLAATLLFAAAAQAAVVKVSLKGVSVQSASQATVLIIAEAQNRHLGGNWTVSQVKVAQAYVKTSPVGHRYRYISRELTKYVKHPPAGRHDGHLAFIGAAPATILILAQAQNGHLTGNWTTAQVRAALTLEKKNPWRDRYPDVPGLLEDYLASPPPGAHTGSLAYTGVSPLVFALGLALAGCGLLLRRLRRA
jgi:hypothetical protein